MGESTRELLLEYLQSISVLPHIAIVAENQTQSRNQVRGFLGPISPAREIEVREVVDEELERINAALTDKQRGEEKVPMVAKIRSLYGLDTGIRLVSAALFTGGTSNSRLIKFERAIRQSERLYQHLPVPADSFAGDAETVLYNLQRTNAPAIR